MAIELPGIEGMAGILLGAGITYGMMRQQVATIVERLAKVEARQDRTEQAVQQISTDIARMDAKMDIILKRTDHA